jgi:hypothetical protein
MPATNLLLASKVVIVETPPSVQTIQGVPTSIIGFIGVAKRGPIGTPQFFTSFTQFVKTFGSYVANSYLALAVEGAFRNGASQVWVSRTCHYTDVTNKATATAAAGSMNLGDRGGAAAAASIQSSAEPFALAPNQHLDFTIDAGSAQVLTFTATPATIVAGSNQPYVLADLETITYQVKLPGSGSLLPAKTIVFHTADFSNIAAATAAEVAAAINKDPNTVGMKAQVSGTAFQIVSDKKGSGAQIVVTGGTALAALGLTAGTTNGTGNVADIDGGRRVGARRRCSRRSRSRPSSGDGGRRRAAACVAHG